MPIPDYQSLMLPVLQFAAQGEVKLGDVVKSLAQKLALIDEEAAELLPSAQQTVFANRVGWAKTYLKKAGLLEPTRLGGSLFSSSPTRTFTEMGCVTKFL